MPLLRKEGWCPWRMDSENTGGVPLPPVRKLFEYPDEQGHLSLCGSCDSAGNRSVCSPAFSGQYVQCSFSDSAVPAVFDFLSLLPVFCAAAPPRGKKASPCAGTSACRCTSGSGRSAVSPKSSPGTGSHGANDCDGFSAGPVSAVCCCGFHFEKTGKDDCRRAETSSLPLL